MVKQTGKKKHEAAYYTNDLSLLKGYYFLRQCKECIDIIVTSIRLHVVGVQKTKGPVLEWDASHIGLFLLGFSIIKRYLVFLQSFIMV